MACRYESLSTNCQSTTFPRERFNIKSSQIRVALPLPSINGCATFISTYLAIISWKELSGIFSITSNASRRYIQLANRKPPFEMFRSRIVPAFPYRFSHSSIPPNRQACICCRPRVVPTSSLSISPDSNNRRARCKLCSSTVMYASFKTKPFPLPHPTTMRERKDSRYPFICFSANRLLSFC